VGQAEPTIPSEEERTGHYDSEIFSEVVERVRAGENYYDAQETVFKLHQYPVHSALNYRTPTYAWFLALLPNATWGQVILCALAASAMLLGYKVMKSAAGAAMATAMVLLMCGVFAWCLAQEMVFYTELWSASLLTLSICAYALRWHSVGTVATLVALFLRELAFPFCAIALFFAAREGRRREVAAYSCALAVYLLFLVFHFVQVWPRVDHGRGLDLSVWLRFGGTAFLLSSCRMNLVLFMLPAWATALYVPMALLGVAAWPDREHVGTRIGLILLCYFVLFAAVGKPFNAYWGLMYAPLLPFGIVWAPIALRDLLPFAISEQ
jgi:hypothetical protein